jgi:glutathione synthase
MVANPIRAVFVMDPLETLSLKKDSTLAMISAAQRRGWDVRYALQGDLYFDRGRPFARCERLTLVPSFANDRVVPAPGETWYGLDQPEEVALGSVDLIMMRKDPPFDMEYIYSTYLLERAEQEGALVVNRPASLRDCNEKFFATAFPQCGPPLLVTRRSDLIRAFQQEHRNIVLKRLDGMGGTSVFRVLDGDANFGVIIETVTRGGTEQAMAQKFIPEISDGDKRILLVDGVPIPFALARVPQAGEARGNLAAGGKGEGRPLTARDRWIAEQLGPELKRRGLYFVGIDVIGDYLTEVNVTCPTCIRELDAQFSLDIASTLLDSIEAHLAKR